MLPLLAIIMIIRILVLLLLLSIARMLSKMSARKIVRRISQGGETQLSRLYPVSAFQGIIALLHLGNILVNSYSTWELSLKFTLLTTHASIWAPPKEAIIPFVQLNAQDCSSRRCNALQCAATQCNAIRCNAMQRSATQCNSMQCAAMQCSTMQCSAM